MVSELNTTQSDGFQLKWESSSWGPSNTWSNHILLLLMLRAQNFQLDANTMLSIAL